MKINFNIPKISEEFIDKLRYLSSINETTIKTTIEIKITNYLDTILHIIKLINESNNLSNEEFHNILNKVCEINFNKTDILNILSQTYNKNFTNYQTIKTSMVTTVNKGNKYSEDFFKEVRTIYRVACEENLFIDEDKTYTIKEIQQLLDNKQIAIVKENAIELDEYIEPKEEYKQFKKIEQSSFLNIDNELYESTINYIKNYLRNEKILSRLIRYIEKLEENIIELEYISKTNNYLSNEKLDIITPILIKINYSEKLTKIKENLNIKEKNKKLIRKK